MTLTGAARLAAQSGSSRPDDGVPASECCLSLLLPIGARVVALGQSLGARPGAEALFLNPAALAAVSDDQFVVHSASTDLQRANTFTLVIRSEIAGSFGLSYRLVDYGDQDATDPFGTVTGTVSTLDHALVATYATRAVAGISAGISYKIFQFRNDCRGFCGEPSFAATTHGVDVGAQYTGSRLPLRLGASIQHLGFPLQLVNAEQADPLPTRFRASGAYEALHHFRPKGNVTAWISAELVESWRNRNGATLHVGAEVGWENAVFVRGGYAGGGGINSGPAIGVGIHYDRFEVAVARAFASTLLIDQEPFHITFAVRF